MTVDEALQAYREAVLVREGLRESWIQVSCLSDSVSEQGKVWDEMKKAIERVGRAHSDLEEAIMEEKNAGQR